MPTTPDLPLGRALELVVDALAVKRLTRLVTEDVILEPIRNRLWRRFPPEDTRVGYFITCPHCVSIWVATGVAGLRMMLPGLWSPVAYGLSLSAVTSLIAERE